MGRDELKSKAEPGGFVEYGKEQLPKINAMRRDKSQPDFYGVPILRDEDVLFTRASEMGDKPASCYTCHMQNADLTCMLMGPAIKVSKVKGSKDSGEQIEYWPCCSMQDYGEPQTGKPVYVEELSNPSTLGLVWINAPEIGQKYGGANCGGIEGGDDCDFYRVKGKTEKWDAEQGFCMVLQHNVEGGAVCSAWRDDDELSFEDAQQLIRGDSLDTLTKRRLVKSILGREDG